MKHAERAMPRAARRDLFLFGYLPALGLIAWLVPEPSWPSICRSAARLAGLASRKRRREVRRIESVLAGRNLSLDAEQIAANVAANHHQARLQMLRCHRGAWNPRIAFAGREHLDRALADGRGAVLWVAPFLFSDLVTKMALHREGFAVTHLSRAGHGLSQSRFGARFWNPIWTALEGRYLAERLVLTPQRMPAVLGELVRRVRANQLVSITLGGQGTRRHAAPFFAEEQSIAEGAPALAHRSGAALLPVFTVRRPDGSFQTTVEPPLRASPQLDRDAAMRELVAAAARLLESYVARWPDQYGAWQSREWP